MVPVRLLGLQILSDVTQPQSTLPPAGGLTLVPVRVAGKPRDETIVLRTLTGWELSLPLTVDPVWLTDILTRPP